MRSMLQQRQTYVGSRKEIYFSNKVSLSFYGWAESKIEDVTDMVSSLIGWYHAQPKMEKKLEKSALPQKVKTLDHNWWT